MNFLLLRECLSIRKVSDDDITRDCPSTPRDLFFDKCKGFYCLQLIDRKYFQV
jgi:hypothetical protein